MANTSDDNPIFDDNAVFDTETPPVDLGTPDGMGKPPADDAPRATLPDRRVARGIHCNVI